MSLARSIAKIRLFCDFLNKTKVFSKKDKFFRNKNKERPHAAQGDLDELFPPQNTEMMPIETYENLKRFTEKRSSKYPAFNRLSHTRSISYFTYLRFSPHLRRILCTTNWIERLQSQL